MGRYAREIRNQSEAKNQSSGKDWKQAFHATVVGKGGRESAAPMAQRQPADRRIVLFRSIPETVHSATVPAVVASSAHD